MVVHVIYLEIFDEDVDRCLKELDDLRSLVVVPVLDSISEYVPITSFMLVTEVTSVPVPAPVLIVEPMESSVS